MDDTELGLPELLFNRVADSALPERCKDLLVAGLRQRGAAGGDTPGRDDYSHTRSPWAAAELQGWLIEAQTLVTRLEEAAR